MVLVFEQYVNQLKKRFPIKMRDWNFRWDIKTRILLLFVALTIVTLLWIIFRMDNNLSVESGYFSSLEDRRGHQIDSFNMNKQIVFNGEKIVHVDLKGAPPKISFYERFFDLIVRLGATGVLMEYEDMFPYHGVRLGNISATNGYTLKDIKEINDIAKKLGLKMIPLIQTFGHMEFLLKLNEWKHLREVEKFPQVICPTHSESLGLIKEMYTQVLEAHPNSDTIHIGADEVYLLGKCERCVYKMNTNGWSKQKLFLNHVTAVSKMIKDSHPHVRVLIWDDEFRNIKEEDINRSGIADLIEPVVWKYTSDVGTFLDPNLWEIYANVFPKVWIASAFKGASGIDKYVTNINQRLDNHRLWMQIVDKYSERIKFEGIILTGWQRYDHFSVLCELLPVAIPSLAICLHYVQGLITSTLIYPKNVGQILQCENPYALLGFNLGIPKCNFPGDSVLEGVLQFHQLKQDFTNFLDISIVHGYMSEYNVEHSFGNNLLLSDISDNLDMFKMKLVQIEENLRTSMAVIYDDYTVNEWCDTFIKPFHKNIESLWAAKEKLLLKSHWPRRPFLKDM